MNFESVQRRVEMSKGKDILLEKAMVGWRFSIRQRIQRGWSSRETKMMVNSAETKYMRFPQIGINSLKKHHLPFCRKLPQTLKAVSGKQFFGLRPNEAPSVPIPTTSYPSVRHINLPGFYSRRSYCELVKRCVLNCQN